MKTLLSMATLVLGLAAFGGQAETALVEVNSLRQAEVNTTLSADAVPTYPNKGKAIERTFMHQPPLIPHKDSYSITKKKNGCLTCHSTEKAAKMKATEVDKSHLETDGKFNNQYYFCAQCHVAQADNKDAIVGNTHSK